MKPRSKAPEWRKSVKEVTAEIEHLCDEYGFEHFGLDGTDDLYFGLKSGIHFGEFYHGGE